ncbi:MAG TPA: rhodanese-like domain-containing protein [Vicinamibacterales bacterium]|nr:rhodanese-like domain-containing protein [Vicinamibacterales bacterium]
MTKRVRGLLPLIALAVLTQPLPGRAQQAQGAQGTASVDARARQSTSIRISYEELKKLRAANEVVVVDVRSPQSYAAGHIPGALSVPLENLQSHVPRLRALDKPIVTYCA